MALDRGTALIVVEGSDIGRIVPIRVLPFQIGRQPENDLVLADDQVSRHHARIEMGAKGLEVLDLRSRNGVFVNQQRVESCPLRVGDRIRVGATVLLVQENEEVARDILAQSVPDSPAFAMEPIQDPGSQSNEPTSIRYLVDSESVGGKASAQTLTQVARLFGATMPPQEVASQVLDIFFQGFSPDRAQIVWNGEPPLHAARSRQEGKKCSPFEIPREVTLKAKDGGALSLRAKVPVTFDAGSQERPVIISPLFVGKQLKGWLYADRDPEQFNFGSQDQIALETLSLMVGGILEKSSVLEANRRLRGQISLMEKYMTPDVVRMLSSKGVNIEETALTVEEREVTVLFSDIQGFTSLSERLSAPEIAELLNEYFQRMVDVITVHHGEVNKFIGDAIMALFGAPKSHGNDASNAVAAGLDMIETLQRFWKEIDDRKHFNIRVGINTGKVVAGNIGSEKKMEYTVLGDEVNVASRLEGISPPNRLTIGARTAQLVRDVFDLEVVPEVKVKGKSKAMEVYRVIGPKKS